jgi:hypothetical protein
LSSINQHPAIDEPAPVERVGDFRPAFGQTHKRATISVCQRWDRDPHSAYRFMQDVQHAQFGGLTDHCHNMWPTEMLYVRKLAEYYYFPGEFIAFRAYEWPSTICKEAGGHNFGRMNPLMLEEQKDLEIYIPPEPHGGSAPDIAPSGGSCKSLLLQHRQNSYGAQRVPFLGDPKARSAHHGSEF